MENLLLLIEALGGQTDLRRFACWAARQTEPRSSTIIEMLDEVESLAERGVEFDDIYMQYRTELEGAPPQQVQGRKRSGSRNAAAFLSAYACLLPDATEAAGLAVERARVWYQLETGEPDYYPFDELLAGKARMMIAQRLNGVLEN